MLELTLDYPRPPQPSGRGGAISFELEPVQLVGMRALAAGCGATLFMALLAVWQVMCRSPVDTVLLFQFSSFQSAGLAECCLQHHACHNCAGT